MGLGACGAPLARVRADAEAVRERTVPPGGWLAAASPLRRDGHSARASWRVETELAWSAYAPWVEQQLGEFRVAERGRGLLRLSRQLEGDLYVLALVARPGSRGLTVEASFEALPF